VSVRRKLAYVSSESLTNGSSGRDTPLMSSLVMCLRSTIYCDSVRSVSHGSTIACQVDMDTLTRTRTGTPGGRFHSLVRAFLRKTAAGVGAIAALLFISASAGADTIVFNNITQGGLQENFVVGMDFTVGGTPVTVTQLGAFDSNQDGIVNTITVGIFNLSGALIGSSATLTNSSPGTLIGLSRFVSVTPFLLPSGTYSIVAAGFTGGDTFSSNTGLGATTSFDSFGGALSLIIGGGRWNDSIATANMFQLPTENCSSGCSNNVNYNQSDPVFQAGTFAVVAAVPDAGLTSMMLGLGVLTMGWMRRRIKP